MTTNTRPLFYKMNVDELYAWIDSNNLINGEVYWDEFPDDDDEDYQEELECMADELYNYINIG